MRVYPVVLLLVGLWLSACGDPPGPSGETPDGPSRGTPDDPSPGTPDTRPGSVRITTTTTGFAVDLDGYRLLVQGTDQGHIDANATIEISGLAAGTRTFSLTGLSPNCAVDGSSFLTVTIVPAGMVSVAFVVRCNPPPETVLLAYGASGGIYIGDLDGSYLRLTTDGGYSREPAWSPDGRRIAFTKAEGEYGAAIYVIDADGANQKRLTPEGAYSASPTWSPDGSRIAFETRRDSTGCGLSCWLDTEIFVMNADGTNPVQLSNRPEHHDVTPTWSPDGNRIAFVSDTFGERNIYVMNADGSHRVNLITDGQYAGNPAWSPDGRRLVFTRLYGVLHIMNADGTNLAPLMPAGSESRGWTGPAWSPDGLTIAATRRTDCHTDHYGDPVCHIGIWVVGADGSQMHELPLPARSPSEPSWRP